LIWAIHVDPAGYSEDAGFAACDGGRYGNRLQSARAPIADDIANASDARKESVMRRCPLVLTIAVAIGGLFAAGHVDAQQPVERAPSLAELAAESNRWLPVCEPGGPTPGLWDGYEGCSRWWSWQECCMSVRDGLGWLFARPRCNFPETSSCRGGLFSQWLWPWRRSVPDDVFCPGIPE
jgi:hypothetical protein